MHNIGEHNLGYFNPIMVIGFVPFPTNKWRISIYVQGKLISEDYRDTIESYSFELAIEKGKQKFDEILKRNYFIDGIETGKYLS